MNGFTYEDFDRLQEETMGSPEYLTRAIEGDEIRMGEALADAIRKQGMSSTIGSPSLFGERLGSINASSNRNSFADTSLLNPSLLAPIRPSSPFDVVKLQETAVEVTDRHLCVNPLVARVRTSQDSFASQHIIEKQITAMKWQSAKDCRACPSALLTVQPEPPSFFEERTTTIDLRCKGMQCTARKITPIADGSFEDSHLQDRAPAPPPRSNDIPECKEGVQVGGW